MRFGSLFIFLTHQQSRYNNDYLTAKGQRRYTAEIIYRYITGENDFSEEHKGIDDVLIEKELLRYFSSIAPDTESALWPK